MWNFLTGTISVLSYRFLPYSCAHIVFEDMERAWPNVDTATLFLSVSPSPHPPPPAPTTPHPLPIPPVFEYSHWQRFVAVVLDLWISLKTYISQSDVWTLKKEHAFYSSGTSFVFTLSPGSCFVLPRYPRSSGTPSSTRSCGMCWIVTSGTSLAKPTSRNRTSKMSRKTDRILRTPCPSMMIPDRPLETSTPDLRPEAWMTYFPPTANWSQVGKRPPSCPNRSWSSWHALTPRKPLTGSTPKSCWRTVRQTHRWWTATRAAGRRRRMEQWRQRRGPSRASRGRGQHSPGGKWRGSSSSSSGWRGCIHCRLASGAFPGTCAIRRPCCLTSRWARNADSKHWFQKTVSYWTVFRRCSTDDDDDDDVHFYGA